MTVWSSNHGWRSPYGFAYPRLPKYYPSRGNYAVTKERNRYSDEGNYAVTNERKICEQNPDRGNYVVTEVKIKTP